MDTEAKGTLEGTGDGFFPDNLPITRPQPVAEEDFDGEEDAEEGTEEEAEGDSEGEEETEEVDEQPKKAKELQFEDEGPAPPQPVTYEQAYAYYFNHNMVRSLKKSGFEVAEDMSNLEEVMRDAAREDPMGFSKVQEWARGEAKTAADTYHRDKIQPYVDYHTKKGIRTFLERMTQEYEDLPQYLPAMKKLQESFFKKWPELLNDPVRALPLLYMEAKRGGKAESRSPKRTRALDTGGMRGGGSKKNSKKKSARDVNFKELLSYGTDKFVGGLF